MAGTQGTTATAPSYTLTHSTVSPTLTIFHFINDGILVGVRSISLGPSLLPYVLQHGFPLPSPAKSLLRLTLYPLIPDLLGVASASPVPGMGRLRARTPVCLQVETCASPHPLCSLFLSLECSDFLSAWGSCL